MAGIIYNIVLKDSATANLTKINTTLLKTESAAQQAMRSLSKGSKNATPSIDSLRVKLEKLNKQKGASFNTRDIRKFNGDIRKTERQLKKLENLPPLSVAERFRKIGSSVLSTVGPLAGAAAIVGGVGASFRSAITTGASFGKEMSNVKALTGATGTTFEGLHKTARSLGATTSFSAKEAAEGMSFLAQAGFNTEEITAALPATLNLAAAGSVALGEAADISSNVLSGFGMKATETERVVDIMAKTTSTANTDIREMGEAMKFFAPTAKTLGISLEESSAAVGLLGNAGIKGSLATQSLGSAFARLAKGGGEVEKISKKIGVDFFKGGQFVGIAGAVEQLEGAFAGMTQQQKAAHLSTLFGQEAFKNIAVLVDSGADKIRNYTEELRNSAGAAKEMANTKLDNLVGDWTKLKSAVSELALTLYDWLRPSLRDAVKWLGSATAQLMKMGGWVIKNSGWIKTLVAGVITYIGVMKVAKLWTGLVTKAKARWAASSALATIRQKGLTRATVMATIKQRLFNKSLLGNPVIAITAAVIALGVAIAVYASSVSKVSAAQQAQLDVAKQAKAAMVEERTEAETLIAIFKDHTTATEVKTAAYEKLKSLYPDILGQYKDEKEALSDIDTLQNNIIAGIERRAKAQAAANLLVAAYEKLHELESTAKVVTMQVANSPTTEYHYGEDGKLTTKQVPPKEQYRYEEISNSNQVEIDKLNKRIDTLKEFSVAATSTLLKAGKKPTPTPNPQLTPTSDPAKTNANTATTTEAIVTGGKRQQIFNIQIGKVLEMGDQVITEGKVQAEEQVDALLEGLTRRLGGTIRSAAT